MYGSDAMALSMIVSIPDLVYTCMEPMETARDNLHTCGLTYGTDHKAATSALSQTLSPQQAHLSSATTQHAWE